ncbi:MAG: hypothetical protein Q9162_005056 [Coniocarpon cinnabarinum]
MHRIDIPKLNATSLQAIYKYKIATKVPLDGDISYPDLATATDMEEVDVRRIVRFASVFHRVFAEKQPGRVSHTAASRYLADNPEAMAGVGFMFDECYQAFAHTVEAMETHKRPEANQSGWAIASGSNVAMWEHYTAHPELGQRAGQAMNAFTKGAMHDTRALTDGYDWKDIDARNGTVVDLGGAGGHATFAIARANPNIQCVIQELPHIVDKFKSQVPQDIANRTKFEVHDFFKPQTTIAQAYLFRQTFHNWNDENCIKMLRALIPALKPGAKVIANDLIVPPPGVLPAMQERGVRAIDMIMMSLFNSREREKADWETLFKEADERFRDVKCWKPEGSQLGLIEATWSG